MNGREIEDLTGKVFGTKKVLGKYSSGKDVRWKCECQNCGKITYPTRRNVIIPCICTRLDLTGRMFGDKIVLSRRDLKKENLTTADTSNTWVCQCIVCGEITFVSPYDLQHGRRIHCHHKGLFDEDAQRVYDSYVTSHPLYHVFTNMNNVCTNPESKYFDIYGGKGITICDEWFIGNGNLHTQFIHFLKWSMENGYVQFKLPSGRNCCRLVRLDKNGPFSPENCEWQFLNSYLKLREKGAV